MGQRVGSVSFGQFLDAMHEKSCIIERASQGSGQFLDSSERTTQGSGAAGGLGSDSSLLDGRLSQEASVLHRYGVIYA
jgi:hypothetical protein